MLKRKPTKPNLGAHKIAAANHIHRAARAAKAASDLKARNAYRLAIGLPPATS